MRRIVVTVVCLTLAWTALWESLTWANLAGGLAAASVVIWLIPPRRYATSVDFRIAPALNLLGYFGWKLVQASAIVAREIATPGDDTKPAVVAVPLHTSVPSIVTTVANMISLTPGTLTLDVEPATSTLYVHVLHFESPQTTQRDIQRLERLTVAAFPPRATESARAND